MAYKPKDIENCFNAIISNIQNNGMSLRNALNQDEMPSNETFYKWLEDDGNKSKQYARACKKRADVMFEEIIEIADASSFDKKIVDGIEVVDNEVIQRSRLRVDARKWAVSKMNPKKYGDSQKVDLIVDDKRPNTPEERAQRIKELKEKLN